MHARVRQKEHTNEVNNKMCQTQTKIQESVCARAFLISHFLFSILFCFLPFFCVFIQFVRFFLSFFLSNHSFKTLS